MTVSVVLDPRRSEVFTRSRRIRILKLVKAKVKVKYRNTVMKVVIAMDGVPSLKKMEVTMPASKRGEV